MPLKNKFSVWSPKSLDLGVSNFFNWLYFLTHKSKDLGLQPASNKLNYKTFMLCCAARHGSLYESIKILCKFKFLNNLSDFMKKIFFKNRNS